jgi:hypothetical protein
MKQYLVPPLYLILIAITLAACGSSCPPETVTYMEPPFPGEEMDTGSQPEVVLIKGKDVLVDEVITGPACNDTWRGTVYLTCDIQIPAWERDPFFFQDCDLEIDEEAVVYVQAHRDKSYNKGCSCHE